MTREQFDALMTRHGIVLVGEAAFRVATLVADEMAAERHALRHRVRELEEAMRLCGIDHASLLRIATAIRGSAP